MQEGGPNLNFLDQVPIIWWVSIGQGAIILLLMIVCVKLSSNIEYEKSLRRSQSTRYGQISEQFLPLVAQYPYNPKDFRFLGTPIDGLQFEDDKIELVDFKAANSNLSTRQRKVRDLVNNGKVEFREIRIN